MSSKDKTQLEERLRRVPGVSSPERPETAHQQPSQISRLGANNGRSGSPAASGIARIGGLPRPASPSVGAASRLARPSSPAASARSSSPIPSGIGRPTSPARSVKPPTTSHLPGPSSPSNIGRPKTFMPSKLGPPKARPNGAPTSSAAPPMSRGSSEDTVVKSLNGSNQPGIINDHFVNADDGLSEATSDITVTISSILSNDPSRSVDALKKIQKVLELGPQEGPSFPQYRELAEHTEGLIETITLQMAHVFERPDDITRPENFRLAKHLIQTLNAFCDHEFLAESLTVDILTSLLEELTLRLLQTDNSPDNRVKDLSRFINMIILRLFATARRMSIFRSVDRALTFSQIHHDH